MEVAYHQGVSAMTGTWDIFYELWVDGECTQVELLGGDEASALKMLDEQWRTVYDTPVPEPERCTLREIERIRHGNPSKEASMGDLLVAAKAAIDRMFSDTSVPLKVTLERLKELREEVGIRIEAIEGDIRRRDR